MQCRSVTRCNLTQHVALLNAFYVIMHDFVTLSVHWLRKKIQTSFRFHKKITIWGIFSAKTRLLIDFTQQNKQWLNQLTSKNIDAKIDSLKNLQLAFPCPNQMWSTVHLWQNPESKFAMCNFIEILTLRQRIVQKGPPNILFKRNMFAKKCMWKSFSGK